MGAKFGGPREFYVGFVWAIPTNPCVLMQASWALVKLKY